MIAPYNCVGLIPTVWGIRTRADIMKNIEHLGHLTKAAAWLSRLDIPVRLLVIPEGGLQGFNVEVLDLDHVEFANSCAIDIPGPETEALGKLAREYDVFIMAQAKAKHPDWKDRFFNVGFVLDPTGEVILKHYKLATLYPVEHSMTPHDVFDWWIEKYGRTLDAFWPVVETEIGRLGVMMANEASYPENGRGLAMNGCEIAYRASFPHPGTGKISSRSRRARGRWKTTCMCCRRTWGPTTCSRTRRRRSIPSAAAPTSSTTAGPSSASRNTAQDLPTLPASSISSSCAITEPARRFRTG